LRAFAAYWTEQRDRAHRKRIRDAGYAVSRAELIDGAIAIYVRPKMLAQCAALDKRLHMGLEAIELGRCKGPRYVLSPCRNRRIRCDVHVRLPRHRFARPIADSSIDMYLRETSFSRKGLVAALGVQAPAFRNPPETVERIVAIREENAHELAEHVDPAPPLR